MDKQRLKEIFGDGKRPTGADFAALIDALWANIENQLANTMRVVRIQHVGDSVPNNFDVGQYWWNPSKLVLIYMADRKAESVDLRSDRLYVVEESGDYGDYLPGVYVAVNGELRYIDGEVL